MDNIWEAYDKDCNGVLDFEETKTFVQEGLKNLIFKEIKYDEHLLVKLFERYDLDKSGTLDKREMPIMIKSILAGGLEVGQEYNGP